MIKNVNCKVCHAPGTMEFDDDSMPWIVQKFCKCFTCNPCVDARAKEQKQMAGEKLMQARREKWQEICPDIYRTFDPDLCLSVEMSNMIANWEPKEGMGMIVIGPSRSGKTRAVYRMLERYFMEGKKIFIARGTQWTNWAIDAARGDAPARKMIQIAHDADITAIDDFAKNAWTERVEGEFWDLMEDRGSKLKPVILTTTESSEIIALRMGQNSTDILKRIREFCEPVIWR